MKATSFQMLQREVDIDSPLLTQVYELIYTNCTDPDFSTQRLADEIGVSRMHIYRKLKEAHDTTACALIRLARLDHAAQLLAEPDSNVAAVTYEVGFNHPSYFARRFREVYGVSPSEYRPNRI